MRRMNHILKLVKFDHRLLPMNLQPIFTDCALTVDRYETVYGGDINQCYHLYTTSKEYFLKINDSVRYPCMFEKEAHGLNALRGAGKLIIPEVIGHGIKNEHQYLLLEWLDVGNPVTETWPSFGSGMAALHKKTQIQFGWEENNYIGSLPQINTWLDHWGEFYSECRIMPLVAILGNRGLFTENDRRHAESLAVKLDGLFPPEPPALLHGDLWSGNYMITNRGEPALFDPSVYYGHREMDIGMSRLFGGFNNRFYESYNEAYPLEPAWEQRLPLTQLYPLLVHAVLFGGSYTGRCREILKAFAG